jgi:asparagine synthase (glutamine-hydrolysing)
MRLICGIFQLNGEKANEKLLRNMAAQMDVPRLQPSLRLWTHGPVGLAVLDFAAHGAPAFPFPETEHAVMAADVRLDEPDRLGRTLAVDAPEDALLLAALEKSGPSGLDRVLGDFAFASWNKSAQRLVCARDAFGIRPFAYVHRPGEIFAFASLPKALHGSGIIPKTIDEDALARRMISASRADDSLVAGIKRLPAAHFLEVSGGGVSLKRYWQLDRAAVGKRNCSPESAAGELRRLVDQAVKCRLPRGGEIGAHLSGGLDSSAISVLAARQLRQDGRTLHAYSFLDRQRNDITLEDETEFVRAVLDQEGDIDWTPVRPPAAADDKDGPMDIDKMTSLDPEAPENQVCARAQAQGVGLILSGWGGDEASTFNGRGALAELFLHGRWRRLAREISGLKRERGWSVSRILYGEVLSYLFPDSVIGFAKRLAGKSANLSAEFPRSLSVEARKRLAASGDEGLGMAPDGRENRWRLITNSHIAHRAEVWAQTGARHGLAFAFPLLDRRVVEYALSLPSELFLRDGFRRRPFRDAMAGVLPERVRLNHQKSAPFPSNIIVLAESKDSFIAQIESYEQNERICRLIDFAHLRRLVGACPSADRAREELREKEDNPAGTASIMAAVRALKTAAYLDQHGGGRNLIDERERDDKAAAVRNT